LTYNGLTSKWVNFNKPSYYISEQLDFNNTITPTDLDYMVYNSSLSKWEPKTIPNDTPSYMRIIQTADNIDINTTIDATFNKFNLF